MTGSPSPPRPSLGTVDPSLSKRTETKELQTMASSTTHPPYLATESSAKRLWPEKKRKQLMAQEDQSQHWDPKLLPASMATIRRPRADTMPSHSTAFPYTSSERLDPLTTSVPSSTEVSHAPTSALHLRIRSGSVTTPPTLAAPFGNGIFNTWLSDIVQSPTTPTTDQLLKGDDGNTIASTLASLGLDDERDRRPTLRNHPSQPSLRSSDHDSGWFRHANHETNDDVWPYYSRESATVNYSTFRSPHMVPVTTGTENPSKLGSDNMRVPSMASMRFEAQTGRPRAISMSVADDRQIGSNSSELTESPEMGYVSAIHPSIWHSDGLTRPVIQNDLRHRNRPFLRSCNSSADLLEMIARQRKVAAVPSSITIGTSTGTEDMHTLDDWTGGEGTPFAAGSQSSSYDIGSFADAELECHSGRNSPVVGALQIPTRSLWLGNIDPTLTVNDLVCLFSQYGEIDNVRILPDRECAFVNYTTTDDALRAKEVLNMMGNRLGNMTLKVGFGRPEAVPQSVCGEMGINAQGPTRALWIGNIPGPTTSSALLSIFSVYGAIESVRVLTHKNCAFVNFEQQEDAVRAKKALHNKEITGPGTGAVRIGFAKVPTKTTNLSPSGGTAVDGFDATMQSEKSKSPLNWPSSSPNNTNMDGYQAQQMMIYMMTEMMGGDSANIFAAVAAERQLIMKEFGEEDNDGPVFDELHMPAAYYSTVPAAPELGQTRKIDIARLREIRRKLDIGSFVPTRELENIANECIDELVELCSDYIGNTIVQRLFERCLEGTKSRMLEVVAPYLASIGVHKNGTWAAQKIIDTARLPSQMNLVCAHIKYYVPALLLDQFGNYVVQGCLSLGPEQNQFIFDAIVDSCWEIAQGRFGARAVRATLESPHVTKRQQKYVAATLVQHALLLATNANGALLLIWLLDTSGIPGRYRILAPRLTPHLARLCTHKLASLTVLKLVNQRQEPDARTLILDTLFFAPTDQVIDEILMDQVHGVGVVQKILSSSYVELRERQRIAERVKQLLGKLKLQHVQGYKRLMEEINMVMGDSNPVASLATLPGFVPPSFINPELAAALHAKYMAAAATATGYSASQIQPTGDNDTNESSSSSSENNMTDGTGTSSLQSQALAAAAIMANFYAAASASSSSMPTPGAFSDALGFLKLAHQQQQQQQPPPLASTDESHSRRTSMQDKEEEEVDTQASL